MHSAKFRTYCDSRYQGLTREKSQPWGLLGIWLILLKMNYTELGFRAGSLLMKFTWTCSQFCICITSTPSTMQISKLLSKSVLSSLSAAILKPRGLEIRISQSINFSSFAGIMTTLQAFLVILMPNRKLSSLFPRKFTRWSMGKSALVEGLTRGSSSSWGREKEETKDRWFSIWVPAGARGKRWVLI